MEEWKKCFSDEAAIYFLWGMCEHLGVHRGLDEFRAFSLIIQLMVLRDNSAASIVVSGAQEG